MTHKDDESRKPASEDLRREWKTDSAAIDYLTSRGYFLRDDWTWRPPERSPTPREERAIQFLVEGYGFAGWRV